MKKESKVKVCFFPELENSTNLFLVNLVRLLEQTGNYECSGFYDLVRKRLSPYRCDIFHFNWFDQCENFSSFVYRLFVLLRVIVSGKRIVWTVHNIESHEVRAPYNRILRFLLLHYSHVIHVMSEKSFDIPYLRRQLHKVKLIPHGDYFESYPKSSLDVRAKFKIAENAPIALFLGAVRYYKNVDVLINAFAQIRKTKFPEAVLLICGKASPKDYQDALEDKISTQEGVYFFPEFVPNEEVYAYLKSAAFLVTPYSYRSSLNSGTALMACSYEKTVVTPDIANVVDIQKQSECLYVYHYESNQDHENALAQAMVQAFEDYYSGKIREKELAAMNYMKNNSWSAHCDEWISLYRG